MLVIPALAVMVAATGPAVAASARAQNGAELPMPSQASLGCAEMSALLATYTESGYRGVHAPSRSHPDRPIYDYEHRLATAFFERCQRKQNPAVPVDTFRKGFE